MQARTVYFIGAAVQVHELLQETAASITLRPFVTPCSAAVRAQHMELVRKSMVQKSNFPLILSPFLEAQETQNDARSSKMTSQKIVEENMKKWSVMPQMINF